MITSDIKELSINDLNEYKEDRSLLLTENEKGYWRKLTIDPHKNTTGTGYPLAYCDNEIISTNNIDGNYIQKISQGEDYIDSFYDFSSGIPTWGLQTSDSGTFRWEPSVKFVNANSGQLDTNNKGDVWFIFNRNVNTSINVTYFNSSSQSWSSTISIDSGGVIVSNPYPQIKQSNSGIAIAAWVKNTGSSQFIRGTYYNPSNQTWITTSSLSNATATSDTNPQLSINDNGDGVAVWQSPQSDGSIVVQASLFNSTSKTWQSIPTNLSLGVHQNVNPQAGIDNNGNIIAIWNHTETTQTYIESAIYDANTNTWSTPIAISDPNNTIFPNLSVSTSGDAMATWLEEENGKYVIKSKKYLDQTKTWSQTSYTIETLSSNQYPAKVAMSNLGTAIVIYSKPFNGQYEIKTSRYDPEKDSWNNPFTLDKTILEENDPSISITDIGNGVAIWIQTDGTNKFVQSSTFKELYKTWSLPDRISSAIPDAWPEVFSTQVITEGNRAAAIWSLIDENGINKISGSPGVINPYILTANDEKVSFSFRKVQEVGEPENISDMATKSYVDNQLQMLQKVIKKINVKNKKEGEE